MPASTPFLGLYKPGGGSTGLITPDEVVDIDRLNTNADLIDAFAKSYGNAADRNHQLYGPAASVGGVTGMKLGDTYQESDGNKVLWKYDGTNWVTNEGGMYLIRPTSVTNGVIGVNGHVSANAGVDNIIINGVFSSRFRRYRVVADIIFVGGVNQVYLQVAAGGVAVSAANYYSQVFYQTGATLAGVYQSGYNFMSCAAIAGVAQQMVLDISGVAEVSDTYIGATTFTPTAGQSHISGYHQTTAAYDGMRLALSTTGGGRAFALATDIAVYGIA